MSGGSAPIIGYLMFWIHKAFACERSQCGRSSKDFFMDISCASYAPTAQAAPLVKAPEVAPAQSAEVNSTNSAADASASAPQPPVLAALPPGQGTRIDQLV
jgi:hypothetical protein